MAKVTAEVTHNHPEGIKGAQATAAAIFLARTGHSKPEIKQYVEQTFGYDLNSTFTVTGFLQIKYGLQTGRKMVKAWKNIKTRLVTIMKFMKIQWKL